MECLSPTVLGPGLSQEGNDEREVFGQKEYERDWMCGVLVE